MRNVNRVLIYIRVSTVKQAFEDKRGGVRIADGSLEVQKFRALEYLEQIRAHFEEDFSIVNIVEDTKSAKDEDRDGYQQMRSLVENGKIDWIVTSEISRISRDTLEFLAFRKFCYKYGVKLFYIGAPLGDKDHLTDFTETIAAAVAELERKQTSARLKKNITSRLKTDGKINGAEPILGLDKCPIRRGHFVVNQQEIETLSKLLMIFIENGREAETLRIADSKGIRDKGGMPLTKLRFKNILKNIKWRYSGLWYLKDDSSNSLKTIELDHGEVISHELRKRVLERIDGLKSRKLKCGKHEHIYLLSSLLKSSQGFSFNGQIGHGNTKDYRYYYCRLLKQRIEAEKLESIVEERVITYFKNSKVFAKIIANGFGTRDHTVSKLTKELASLKSQFKNLDFQIDGLIRNMAHPNLSSDTLDRIATQIGEFESQKRKLSVSIDEKSSQSGQLLCLKEFRTDAKRIEKFASEFKNLSRLQKRELLEHIFDKIEVLNPQTIKLYLHSTPKWGEFPIRVEKSCDLGLSGGANRT